MKLFEDNWGIDNSPLDETEITTTILYFSKEELKQFKNGGNCNNIEKICNILQMTMQYLVL